MSQFKNLHVFLLERRAKISYSIIQLFSYFMFIHNLKIAFRNLWKYKSQSLISVIGLAVGLTCFALATLWIRYEMTFDSFHKNAKQMYVVYRPNIPTPPDYVRRTTYTLAAYLKETIPEIADAISVGPSNPYHKMFIDDVELPALTISADSSFCRMFDVKILEGSRDFLIPGSNKLAITLGKARQVFGDENPIGKTVNNGYEDLTICAIVSGMPKRSNYAFDFIQAFSIQTVSSSFSWYRYGFENTIIKLFPGTNVEAFEKKLYELETGDEKRSICKMMIKPLTKLHYTDPDIEREVKFKHILIFALSGLLVILCSLFNYLTLFISRFRIRQKELALRVVCGASGGSLLVMLLVEFMLTLLLAVVLGNMLTQWLHRPFLALSNIQMDLPAIYRESLVYIGGVILISLLVFWLLLSIFRQRSLNVSLRRKNKKMFHKISVVVQLIISIGFAFCTIIILKQMYFLHHSGELGFSVLNRGIIIINEEEQDGVLANQLNQIPEIVETVDITGFPYVLPISFRTVRSYDSWDDKPADAERVALEIMYVSPEYNAFYDFRLVAGEMMTDADSDSLVLLNESAVKAFGWHNPVGKRFDNQYLVKGVIKNVYNFAPTEEIKPAFYMKHPSRETMRVGGGTVVLFKYRDSMWKSCKEKIEQLFTKEYADSNSKRIYNLEEEYNKYLKSENSLIKLLSSVSAVCILICMFGFVSLVSLTCEERRKAIAIRKINGATANDILSIFVKEYSLLLIIGAAIAFPAGYIIMQRWLEQYVKQTSIPAWIYLLIILVLVLLIALCVGWRVYKSSIENPADVVKGG